MSFSTILFTEKGRALQAKAQAGIALNFTKLAMGSGSLGGQSQITLTTLIEPKVILPINEIKRNPTYATIKGIFRNQDISTGFYWREIGLFAQDPDIGEILYCYGNAGTLAEYIPPQTSEIIEKVVSITAMIGDAATVTASIDESLVYVTKPELDAVSQKADQAFQSASNGKVAIKAAITGVDPEVTIPTEATFTQLAAAIGQIKTGVDTEDATAIAEQILNSMTAYVKGVKVTGTMPNLMDDDVSAADGYDIPSDGKIYLNLSLEKDKPYAVDGYTRVHVTYQMLLDRIINLDPGDLRAGAKLFGMSGKPSVVDTADANVTAGQMLNGYSGYVNGTKANGNIPITNPDVGDQLTAKDNGVSAGPYSGDGLNYAYMKNYANTFLNGVVYLRHYEPDLIPQNILSGKSIMGVSGLAVSGRRSQSGTATTLSNGKFENLLTTGYTTLPYIVVSGLTFLPSYILISWSEWNTAEATTIYDTISTANYNKIFKVAQYSSGNPTAGASYAFKADARSAYVNNTGFLAPVNQGGPTYNWLAIE